MYRTKARFSKTIRSFRINQRLAMRGLQSLLTGLLIQNTRREKKAIQLFEEAFAGMRDFRK